MNLETMRVIFDAARGPSQAVEKLEDRLLLFALIFGIKPKRCLEIGTFQGGSAQIIVSALDACGQGKLVSIDPAPKIPEEVRAEIAHRHELIVGPSPACIAAASKRFEEGRFDFVFIDGDHDRAYADIEGVLPFLAHGAYLLCHDCFYKNVKRDIQRALSRFPQLVDCGILGNKFVEIDGHPWTGTHMLRFTSPEASPHSRSPHFRPGFRQLLRRLSWK